MNTTQLEKVKATLEANPGVLDSLNPLEQWVLMKVCKGLDRVQGKTCTQKFKDKRG